MPTPAVALTAVLLTGWSAFSIGGLTGVLEGRWTVLAAISLVGLPVASWTLALMGRRDTESAPLKLVVGWSTLIAAALLGTVINDQAAIIVLAIPVIVISAYMTWRWPVAAVVLIAALTGTYGTFTAYLPVVRCGVLIDLVLAGLWGGLLWQTFVKERTEPVRVYPGIVLAVTYSVITLVMIITAPTMEQGLRGFHVAPWYMTAFILIGYAGWSREVYEKIAKGVLLVALGVGAYATFRYIVGPSAKETALAQLSPYNTVGNDLRLIGSFGGGHELGFWTACVLPFTFALTLARKNDRWRLVAGGATILLAVALFGSGVRGSLAACIIGLAVVLFLFLAAQSFAGLKLASGIIIPSVCALAGVVLFGFVVSDTSRYTAILHPSTDSSFLIRQDKWRDALDGIKHPLGEGLGSAGLTQQRYGEFKTEGSVSVESGYVILAYQQGYYVAALVIAALLATIAMLAMRAIATQDRRKAGIAIAAVGTLVATAAALITDAYQEGLPVIVVWLILGLGVAQFAKDDPLRQPAEEADGAAPRPLPQPLPA